MHCRDGRSGWREKIPEGALQSAVTCLGATRICNLLIEHDCTNYLISQHFWREQNCNLGWKANQHWKRYWGVCHEHKSQLHSSHWLMKQRPTTDGISSLPPSQYITALPSFCFVHFTDKHDWYGCQFHITFVAVDFIGRASNYCTLLQKILENSSARYWIVKSNIIIEHISGYNILIYKIIVVNTVYQDLMCLCVKY